MAQSLRTSVALFLIALTTLMAELLLTRVFDVILQPNLAYMIITNVMFAFGLAGVYAAVRPFPTGRSVGPFLAKLSVVFGVLLVALLPVLNAVPFEFNQIFDHKAQQLCYFGVTYLALVVPFFVSGLIFTTLFSTCASHIRRLYLWDLCGAAVGCVVIVPFLPRIGPGGLLFAACGLCLAAAALFDGRRMFAGVAVVLAVLVTAVPWVKGGGYIDFVEHANKRALVTAKQLGHHELTIWDPISKIDVVKQFRTDATTGQEYQWGYHVAYDGGQQSTRLWQFDGDLAGFRAKLEADPAEFNRQFWQRGVAVSHWLKADSNAQVLIIGSAGGQETRAALAYNAGHVDAIEMVSAVVRLVTKDYADYIGHIFQDPRVSVQVGEGRTFLRNSDRKYDIIQIFSNHTSSSIASGSGAMATTYLMTVDAFKEYFTHLSGDGILHINHHVYERMVTTAAAAWAELGRGDFRKHVVVFRHKGLDRIPTLLVKASPWTAQEIARLETFMTRPDVENERVLRLVENPVNPQASFLSDEFYSGTLSPELVAAVPFRITPTTDDHPYFSFIRKKIAWLEPDSSVYLGDEISDQLNAQLTDNSHVPLDLLHFFVIGAASVVFAIVFVFVPLGFSRTGRAPWPRKATSMLYFACLGAGFIMIELTLIQVFMKLVGYPLYTYSVVIFTMLMAAGLGSGAAKSLDISPQRRWWVPFLGTLVCGGALWVIHPTVFDAFLASTTPVRLIITAAMIFPMSFFMGMPFPLGVLALEKQPAGAIAWAWAINGLLTVVGGVGATVLSIFIGFRLTLLVALAIYGVACLAFGRLRIGAVKHVPDTRRVLRVVALPQAPTVVAT